MSVRRVYETTIIVNAALEDQDIDTVVTKVSGYIENHGGEINEINKWGRRRLAYPINKKYNGYYVHVVFETTPDTLGVLDRFMVLEDTILRHLTLVLPEKMREHRKQKALAEGKDASAAIVEEKEKRDRKSSAVVKEKTEKTEEVEKPSVNEDASADA